MYLTAEVQMWLTFAVILFSIVSYSLEYFSIEITALGSLLLLMLVFVGLPATSEASDLVSLDDLLAGFANPALIAVLALLIIGQGLFQTDALDKPAQHITKLAKRHRYIAFVGVYISAAFISAFINNTPVVVMFIPIMTVVAGNLRLSSSKVLMPLSFISILGGMTTLIGSSTNLLVADAARKAGVLDLNFFDFTEIGLMVSSIGAIYALLVMPKILQNRKSMADQLSQTTGKQFIAQIPLSEGDALVGKKAVAGMFPDLKDMTVRLVQRGETPHLPPFDNVTLQAGDTVVVAATRQALTTALKGGHKMAKVADNQRLKEISPKTDVTLAEVIVPPASRMSGQTIAQASFRSKTNCIVLGVQRRSRMPRMAMSDIRLEAGDVLLVGGARDDVEALRLNKDLLLIELSSTDVPRRRYAPRAILIFLATALATASGLLPIATAALAGAFCMIVFKCLNLRQAVRSLDSRIYMLVGSSLASAVALQNTGGAKFIAGAVVDAMQGQDGWVLLSGLFLLVAVLTNILSNNATAVLFAPIAISIANQTGLPVEPFVVCVILAANCSFATPIGYQTNLLVMGPGHYRFADFLWAGIPLMIIIWLSFTFIAPWYYGL
ncbi:Di-and tricarboxylate transporter [Cohaesibacter marisflavi]|uniref:Di-and tricarboxylate transporter n=1 Tax=Cohaesibacter marisflavi TaxID=655353 RepID=A0A1I5AZV6_9HYPH|nr:SLC13 family permease [Cohaesibacter marisflavi]SFN67998.1 Di-and tricarboxylate transporter [Cohaesibacter marisflavi]